MSLCAVPCSECGKTVKGTNPSTMPYVMRFSKGRSIPVCRPCYEDRRTPAVDGSQYLMYPESKESAP